MTQNPPPAASRRKSILHRFAEQRDGNASLLFALLALPMFAAVGLGVDMSRAIDMEAALQADVDTAALSGAAAAFGTLTQTTTTADSPAAVGKGFYGNAGIPAFTSVTSATQAITTTGAAPGTVTVKATSTAQIKTFFLWVFAPLVTINASATATASVPSSASGLFPFAIPQCAINANLDPLTGKPQTNTIVHLDSVYDQNANCTRGQWTSLTEGGNDVSTVKSIMTNGCSCTVTTTSGQTANIINIDPGTKATLYPFTLANFQGQTVLMAVVSTGTTNGDLTKPNGSDPLPVVSFVPFKITGISGQGNSQSIDGFFVSNFSGGGTSGGSGANIPSLGAVTVALTK